MKKIWRQNNSKLSVLDTEEEKQISQEELVKLLQADVNSQLMWITTRSCIGIPCKDCYINRQCKTRRPSDSQGLAASVIKGAISNVN